MKRGSRLALAAPLLLAACSGGGSNPDAGTPYSFMHRGQCHNADWEEMGRLEARRGATMAVIVHYEQVCTGHGVVVDREAFARGLASG